MSYVSFLWKSSNDHGIHSPFVFSFISTTFYNGSPLRELRSAKISGPLHPRTLRVLYKIIVNRKAFKILVLGAQAREVTEQLRAAAEITKSQLWFFSPLATVPGGVDLGIITGTSAAEILEQWERIKTETNPNSIIVLPEINRNHAAARAWQTLQQLTDATVTIDTHFAGIIAMRKGQAKQHFIIRPEKVWLRDVALGARKLWGLLG